MHALVRKSLLDGHEHAEMPDGAATRRARGTTMAPKRFQHLVVEQQRVVVQLPY